MVTRALALATAAAALLLGGCDQFTKVEGAPVARLARPIVVMHRGAGNSNPDLWENTLPAILHGAGLYDGAEMDVQLSRDGTLWLSHENEVYDCSNPADPRGGAKLQCFQELHDAEIEPWAYCDTATGSPCAQGSTATCKQHYVRLEDVFQLFSTDPTLLQKVLSLDMKDQLCGSFGLDPAREMADALHGLVGPYHMEWRLLVEADLVTFFRKFRENGTQGYLFVEGYGEVDPIIADAAREGADGISYDYREAPFDPTFTEGLRNVGLRVMVWPLPDPLDAVEDIRAVWEMNPDVIKTDRSDLFGHVELPAPF